jgi:hypothetical protein
LFLLVGAGFVAATIVTVTVFGGALLVPGGLSFQLDIFRLMTRGLARGRRFSRWRRISAVAAVSDLARREGGKGRLGGDLAAGDAQGAGEGEPVGIQAVLGGGRGSSGPDGVVDEQEAPCLLLDAGRGLRPQHHPGARPIRNARGVIPPSSRRGKTRGIGLPGACRDGRVHEAVMRCSLAEPGSDVGTAR